MAKWARNAAIAAAGTAGAFSFLIAPGLYTKTAAAPFKHRYFAHRGLHTQDKSIPENSLAAFRRAAEAGYGMELDIQLSKDGEVVVFHDATLNRVCGVDKKVNELTLAELRELRLCGTEERIPLFTEMLEVVGGRTPLIVELKTQGAKNNELCTKARAILLEYKGDYCIESFDPRIVRWFRLNAPWVFRGQLACPPEHYHGELSGPGGQILGRCLANFLGRPQFIAYRIGDKPVGVLLAEAMGAMKFCWTSKDPADKEGNGAVIFEFYEPPVRY